MESIGLETALFLFGGIVLCIALLGRIETHWIKFGSHSVVARAAAFVVGTLLIEAALMMAGILPFGSSKKVQTLTEQNEELRAKIGKLEAKLAEQQTILASDARLQVPPSETVGSGRARGAHLTQQLIDGVQTLEQFGSLRHHSESLAEQFERQAEAILALGDSEAMAKLDPDGDTKSNDGDDSITNARPIALGETVKAEILPFTDKDYYKVLIPPDVARSLRVILRKSGRGLVTEVVIYNQNQEVIESKLDMSKPTLSFSFQCPSGSQLYLSVASQGLPSIYSLTPQQGSYELLIRAE